MYSLIKQITTFLKEDFNFFYYISIIGIFLTMLYINYYAGFSIEREIYSQKSLSLRWVSFFLLYGIAYFSCLAISSLFQKKYSFWSEKDLYIKVFFILSLYSFTRSHIVTLIRQEIAPIFSQRKDLIHISEVLFYVSGAAFVVLGSYIFYRWKDSEQNNFYGMHLKNLKKNYQIYFSMFLITIPIIFIGGKTPSLQNYYPSYKETTIYQNYDLPSWISVLVYEMSYMLNFVKVEMVFRGFLILSLQKILGKTAILPMALVYSFIHFGKPPEEYFSSFFGGYILGIITYKHKSIFFGLILHILLALSMEIVGFWY